MSRGDWISFVSAVATVAATVVAAITVLVSTRQFKLSAQQARSDREADAIERLADASAARQIRYDDAVEARQLRQDEAKINREARLEEARKSWLLTVIIQPSLPVITGFYDNIILTTITSLGQLSRESDLQAANSIDMRNMRIMKAGEINSLKQDFDHSFITLVASQNHNFGQKLRTALNDLEDLIADTIGKLDYTEVDGLMLSEQLYGHKSTFFSILYQEVQQESK